MRLRRMTTRGWMFAVAVVALACATALIMRERKERFSQIARQHSGAFPPVSFVDLIVATEPERVRIGLWSRQVMAWHAEMAKKYRYAARHPYLPVAPDPPEPGR